MEICTEYFRSIAKGKCDKQLSEPKPTWHTNLFERPRRGRGKASEFPDSGGNTDEGRKLYYHLTCSLRITLIQKPNTNCQPRHEGFYYKPRVDWEVLNDHSDGVIATTGCLGGQVLQFS